MGNRADPRRVADGWLTGAAVAIIATSIVAFGGLVLLAAAAMSVEATSPNTTVMETPLQTGRSSTTTDPPFDTLPTDPPDPSHGVPTLRSRWIPVSSGYRSHLILGDRVMVIEDVAVSAYQIERLVPIWTTACATGAFAEIQPGDIEGSVLVTCGGSELVRLDLQTGARRWTAPATLPDGALLDATTNFAVSVEDGALINRSMADGSVLWRHPNAPTGPIQQFDASDQLVFVAQGTSVITLDGPTGTERASAELHKEVTSLLWRGATYASTEDSLVVIPDLQPPEPLSDSTTPTTVIVGTTSTLLLTRDTATGELTGREPMRGARPRWSVDGAGSTLSADTTSLEASNGLDDVVVAVDAVDDATRWRIVSQTDGRPKHTVTARWLVVYQRRVAWVIDGRDGLELHVAGAL